MTASGAGRPVRFEVLGQGPRSGLEPDDPTVRVATGAAAWRDLWDDHHGGDPPAVDHDDRWAGLVLLGGRPTGGYAVTVQGIRREADGYRVRALEHAPGSGDVVTQSITHPWVAVAVDASHGLPGQVVLDLAGGPDPASP